MKPKQILHSICKERTKGQKRLFKTRRALLKALKEYLRLKYKRTVLFSPIAEDPLSNMLDEKEFYPYSVTVTDKYGWAANSTVISVELTNEGKIKIRTSEAGSIEDTDKYLLNDDLFSLCCTIEDYERILLVARRALAESGEWAEHARQTLISFFPKADAELIEYFIYHSWEKLQSDDYNLKLFEKSNIK